MNNHPYTKLIALRKHKIKLQNAKTQVEKEHGKFLQLVDLLEKKYKSTTSQQEKNHIQEVLKASYKKFEQTLQKIEAIN